MNTAEAWAITIAVALGILALTNRGPLRLALLAIGALGAYVLLRVILAA